MRFSALAAFSLGAAFSGMQYCPAPFVAGLGAVLGMTEGAAIGADTAVATLGGGAISGGIGQISKRDGFTVRRRGTATAVKRVDLPPGVSQESFQQCQDQLNAGSNVQLHGIGDRGIRADGVPPACMNLATVLTGDATQEGGPVPTPMGSDSIQYSDISDDELEQLGVALHQKGAL